MSFRFQAERARSIIGDNEIGFVAIREKNSGIKRTYTMGMRDVSAYKLDDLRRDRKPGPTCCAMGEMGCVQVVAMDERCVI
jgi:hypothetical protein